MLHVGFANIGSIREEIQRLPDIQPARVVKRERRRKCRKILVEHRPDIDPTEESNALSWGDN